MKPQVEKRINYTEHFSERTKYMEASDVRELLKIAEMPDVISFAGGIPCKESFPVEEIKQINQNIFKKYGMSPLQYSQTEGIPKLREKIVDYVKRMGIEINTHEVQITTGSQQGLFMCSFLFVDPGDCIISEDPMYLGEEQTLRPMQPDIIGIHMDSNGIKLDFLEDELKKIRNKKKIKFIYTVPNFQNPTGVTIPEKNRKRLIDIANDYDTLIVEDDPYYFLRFEGEDIPSIKSFDDEGRVIYLGSFSKIIAPGLRTGFLIANQELRDKFTIEKQPLDLCSPALTQYIVYDFLDDKNFLENQIHRIKSIYKEKRDAMLDSMEEYFPKEVKWTKPNGGLFIWLTTPDYVDMRELFMKAVSEKVAYVPGDAFRIGGERNCARLSFSLPTKEQIPIGIKKIGDLLKEKIRSY